MSNIVDDVNTIHEALGSHNEEVKETFDRIVTYVNTLEVQKRALSEFLDDVRNAHTELVTDLDVGFNELSEDLENEDDQLPLHYGDAEGPLGRDQKDLNEMWASAFGIPVKKL